MREAQKFGMALFAVGSLLMGLAGLWVSVVSTALTDRLIGLVGGVLFLTGALVLIVQVYETRPLVPELGTTMVEGTELPALIFPENPFKMKLTLAGSLAFVIAGVVMLVFHHKFAVNLPGIAPLQRIWSALTGNPPPITLGARLYVIVGGVLAIAFFGWCAVVAYKRLRHPAGALIITPQGLEFPQGSTRVQVDWQQVEEVFPYQVSTDSGVAFVLAQTARANPTVRRWGGLNRMISGFDLGVSLGISAEPVATLIEFYRTHPELRSEIGTPHSLERYKEILQRWNA